MSTRTVDRSPAALALLVKAALPAVPLLGRLPGIRHTGRDAPDLTLVRRGVTVDDAHLARYRELCAFAPSATAPATYPHLPAFALHLALMTDPTFPLAPMGLVHLRNRVTQHRPIGTREAFDLAVRSADLRPHPKGRLIDIVTEATIGGEVVWDETMTLLSRGRTAGGGNTSPLDGVEAPAGTTTWDLPGDLGRRYAAISGDRNPIHLHPLTARPFGFGRAIAHGMWTLARSLAEVADDLPAAFRFDVEFRRPILLTATVRLGTRREGGSTVLGVTSADGSTTHLVGRIDPVPVSRRGPS